MMTLQNTRSINDACEIQKQIVQQGAPLRFITSISPAALADGTPLDGTTNVYNNLQIYDPFFASGKLTHERTRMNVQVRGMGILTSPNQTSGQLLYGNDVDMLTSLRPNQAEISNTCGRFTIGPYIEAVTPSLAIPQIDDMPWAPKSSRVDQRNYWSGCQDNFIKELKQMPQK
jgi:hypothetical protein